VKSLPQILDESLATKASEISVSSIVLLSISAPVIVLSTIFTLCTALLASSEFPIAFAAMSIAAIVLSSISVDVIVPFCISDESIVLSVIESPQSVHQSVRFPPIYASPLALN